MKSSVSYSELQIIQKALKHGGSRLRFQSTHTGDNAVFELHLDEDEVEEIRDACGDYLLFTGFDEAYNANSKGLVLEKLIDRFLIP